ncbi:MAG: hypothetical protein M3R15_34370 [Acidobacteriota bacterium]|nr:hypothetical protein [Acidobacteriota bacterium]
MMAEEASLTAKDFTVETRILHSETPDGMMREGVIFQNGEPVITFVVNNKAICEAVRKTMMLRLHVTTLISPDKLNVHCSEDCLRVEISKGARQDPQLAASLEASLQNPKRVSSFENLVHEATERVLANIRVGFIECLVTSEEKAASLVLFNALLPPEAARELAKEAAEITYKSERKRIRRSFELPEHGGPRNGRYLWTPENRAQFASKVNNLLGLWRYIKQQYRRNGEDEQWIDMLKASARFKNLSNNCHDVPRDLISRVARDGKNKRHQEPLALACEHAQRELGIPEHKPETLRGHYQEGTKSLPTA